jgi:alpha-beta hydrolase superfamily lysophospholipase
MKGSLFAVAAILLAIVGLHAEQDVWDRVQHGYADSDGVRIQYATIGSGPLIVMVHGFPDFWYSWRHQMAVLSDRYQVVAIDQRGYNLSDKPTGKENYDLTLLVADLRAVVRHFKQDKTIIVGHERFLRCASRRASCAG